MSQPGDLAKELRTPREFDFGGQWDLITELNTGLGKQTLGAHKQNIMHTRTQEKGAVTPQETDPDLHRSVQESPTGAWVNGGLLQSQGH